MITILDHICLTLNRGKERGKKGTTDDICVRAFYFSTTTRPLLSWISRIIPSSSFLTTQLYDVCLAKCRFTKGQLGMTSRSHASAHRNACVAITSPIPSPRYGIGISCREIIEYYIFLFAFSSSEMTYSVIKFD